MTKWLTDWRHTITAVSLAIVALVAAIFVPDERWEKLGHVVERIVEDPAGATVFVGVVAGAIVTLRGAWKRTPPPVAVLLGLLLASAATGCGASARVTRLDTLAAVALVVGTAGDAVEVAAEVDARSCSTSPDVDTCLAPVRERWRPVDATLDSLRLALGAWLVTEQTADGAATWPTTLARLLALYRDLVGLLDGLGVDAPPLPGGL